MASDLDNQLTAILDKAEPWDPATAEKPAETRAEAQQDNEKEGVDNAAANSIEEESPKANEEGSEEAPSDEWDEEFKNLDPEVRDALLKADAETRKAQANAFKKMRANFDRKQTELGQEKKLAETTKQLFQKHGLDPALGLSQIEKLIHFERELEKDPKKVINLLKQKFNLHDEKVSGSNDELDESLLTDEERILYNKQKNIEKTLESVVEENRRLKEEREREDIQKYQQELINFRDAKNEDGSLKNPYFDDLLDDMAALEKIFPKDTPEKLYNKALRMNDELYSKSLEDAKSKERNRIESEKKKALDKAKSINGQSLKTSPKSIAPLSLDDQLMAILERAEAQN